MQIQAHTLSFLKDLSQNNNKPWFDENRDRYQLARNNFIQYVDHLIERLASFNPGIAGLEAKRCIFRINRDIRFSANKDPYKTNFGANITRGGRKSPYAGYYMHLEAGKCFLAGGAYHPMPPELQGIRKEIDLHGEDLRKVIETKSFKETFGELKGDQLKTAPKGYPKDHPDIDLLRYKSLFVVHECDDKQILSSDFLDYAIDIYEEMAPLNSFLNKAIDQK